MHAHQILSLSTARRWAAASLLAGLSMGAIAQSAPVAPAAPAAATAAAAATAPQAASKVQQPSLNIRQIYDRLDAAGYRELQEIEWSDGRYEVKGMNAQGERVKLEVDGNTGEVLRSRTKR
ncbi:PepSY domain-containing protein [Comamonas jiangduensis]|uniref:PepSY domain-containing protein n=1 Tax=Comamonas jiangduensis TaxID=1194168 RepID=UPI0024E17BA4|nr:PepSY domain-containing protein [Comamonas jiangduensis]